VHRPRALGGLAAAALATACGGDGGGGGPDAAGGDAPAGCAQAVPWATAPPLPLGPTQETAAVAVAGRIYVLGGFSGTLGVLRAVQVFDPATCAWSAGPDLPRAIHHANAAVVDGTIYVVGAMVGLDFQAIGDVWRWNPATDAGWEARAAMPAGTARGSAVTGVVPGGVIVVAGGLRGGAVAEVSAYDTARDAWDTTYPPLPAARDHACGAAIDGTLYVAGGRQRAIDSRRATVYSLTPGERWRERAPMPTARGGTACGVVGGELIVMGGEGNPDAASGVFAEVEAYTPATDGWRALPPMPTPRHGLAAAGWDGRLYAPGGADRQGFGAVAVHEVLTP
jgi:N-acetylneuraminic acid mutarotase